MLLMNHETILRSSNLGEIGCNGTPYEFGFKRMRQWLAGGLVGWLDDTK